MHQISEPPAGPAIEAIDLVKHFGETVAVDGVSFSVPTGTVLGLLGPNGAGKTTTVRMMTTLTTPTRGTARVAGHDVVTDPRGVRRSMGLTGQTATVDELLTGRENLRLIGQLYGLDRGTVKRVSDDLLERFSLTDAGSRVVKTYSGGMRRRLDLAVSLVATPPVLFLDEPTTGLDPRSRVELWDVLRELVNDGTTLLLTTQYLEEADQLADNIVVIDHGGIIAEGTPLQLKDASGKAALVVTVSSAVDVRRAAELMGRVVSSVHVDEPARRLTAPAQGLGDITEVAAIFETSGIELDDLGLQRPSLDDVFLHLTGRRAEGDDDDLGEGSEMEEVPA
jgi:ABC-2 type transport system ATP-binding protein